ncbi:UNVERIFIED_ORG: hypothetical protein J2R75_010269 [Bradyrhizobium elkanii]|nr:hypothetical protein [Bradyrhizobium japonicum]
MDRPEQADAHHLRNATRIIAVALVHLRLEERLGMSRLDADYQQASLRQPAEQPLRQRSSLEPNPIKPPNRIVECSKKIIVRVTHQLRFPANAARFVDNAQGRLFDRHVQSSVMFHAALLRLMLVAARQRPRLSST